MRAEYWSQMQLSTLDANSDSSSEGSWLLLVRGKSSYDELNDFRKAAR